MLSLRPYQSEAIDRVRAELRAGKRRVVLTMPTGAGKTVAFASMIAAAVARGKRCLVLAHRRELIRQPTCKLLRSGLPPSAIGVVLAGTPLPKRGDAAEPRGDETDAELWQAFGRRRPDAPVQVASVDSLRAREKPPADLVVIDECHRALAKTYLDILAHYPSAVVVGLTATPCRTDGRGLRETFEAIVCGPSYAELVAAGALVEPRVWGVRATSLPDLESVRTVAGDYAPGELAEACDKPKLVGDIVDHYVRLGGGAPALVFAAGVEHSRHIAAAFVEAGIAAAHVDGETPSEERDAAFAGLASGAVQVVSNCDVATEGIDIPAAKCIILARPTKSLRIYLQQVGRGSRPAPGGHAFVVLDHAGCSLEHGLPQADREWSLDAKKRKKSDGEPPTKQCPECDAVVACGTSACPACGYQWPAREAIEVQDGELVEVRPLTRAEQHDAWDRIVAEWTAHNARAPVPRKPGWCWAIYKERHHQAPPRGVAKPQWSEAEAARRARFDALAVEGEERGYRPGYAHARMAATVGPALASAPTWQDTETYAEKQAHIMAMLGA